MKTYETEAEARLAMTGHNQAIAAHSGRFRYSRLWVMVEGPSDKEFSVMDIREAIENDFTYSWAIY